MVVGLTGRESGELEILVVADSTLERDELPGRSLRLDLGSRGAGRPIAAATA